MRVSIIIPPPHVVCFFYTSGMSVDSASYGSLSSSSVSSSFRLNFIAKRINRKMEKAIIRKSKIDCIKVPYNTSAFPTLNFKFVKSIPVNNIPNNGMIILSTSEVTILPKAAPITTATASSITFPCAINALKSFHIQYTSKLKKLRLLYHFLNSDHNHGWEQKRAADQIMMIRCSIIYLHIMRGAFLLS